MPKLNMDSDFAREPVLLEETYPGTLKEVKEYQKDYGDGPVDKLAWVFAVEATEADVDPDVDFDGDFSGEVEIAAHTSWATSKKSKFFQIGLAKFAGESWDGDTDSLVGNACLLDVVQYKDGNGDVRNGIDRVKPPKKRKVKAGASKKGVEIDESDFEDIPF